MSKREHLKNQVIYVSNQASDALDSSRQQTSKKKTSESKSQTDNIHR